MTDSSGSRAAHGGSGWQWGSLVGARLATRAVLTFIALKLLLLFVLALNSAFVMDEYWMTVHGLFRLDDLYREIWPAKTVLYAAFFRIAHLLAEDSVRIMLLARMLQSLLALAGLGLVYGIARNIGRSRIEALLVMAVMLAFAGYTEWIFMIRPEPIVLVFGLAGLWCVTRRPSGRLDTADLGAGVGLVFVAGLSAGLAFLTQQKAVYLNLALGLALVGDALFRRSLREALRDGAVLVLGWALVVVAYYLFFIVQGAELPRMLGQSLAGPAVRNALAGHLAYEGGLRHFVLRMLFRDPALYILCFAGLVLCARHLLALGQAERRAWIFTVVISVLVFAHRSPWPYNFVLAIPLLGLWAPQVLAAIPAGKSLARPAVLSVLVLVFSVSFVRNALTLAHDNAFQNETVRRAERLLGPGDTYFDGIGMLVSRQHAGLNLPGQVMSWDAPIIQILKANAARGDASHFERIAAGNPKVWILSYRTLALEDILAPYLEDAYVAIYPNVLVAGRALQSGSDVVFRVPWPGRYRLFDAAGRPSEAVFEIDGAPAGGAVALGKGTHQVRLTAAGGPLYLLPADIAGLTFDMTRDLSQKPLFPDVYTF